MDLEKRALDAHKTWRGKIRVEANLNVETKEDLSLAYTPGVAAACLAIEKDPEESYALTRRWNTVAVVTDGTAVLGLGDIGPEAAMPVMEGKALLFSRFAGIDAIPICLDTKDPDEIVRTVELLSKSFGGINLEDISAPRCFTIERRLKESLQIPVLHDDQHGTAVVVTAALQNALRVVRKRKEAVRAVINGAGSAGCAIARLILSWGVGDVVLVDRFGALYEGDGFDNPEHERMARLSNKEKLKGSLAEVLPGADVFIGVSRAGLLSGDMVRTMAENPIVFAMANPTPEIFPEEAKAAGAAVVGTGRSDYPNQINNLLAFPGIFRGALDARARAITDEMLFAASGAIASLVPPETVSAEAILPSPLDERVAKAVARAVAEAWKNA